MSKLEALSEWCENYYKETNIKVHPQNIPVEILLNEIMMGMKVLGHMIKNMTEENERMTAIEQTLAAIEAKLTKPTQKVDKKEVKK